MSTAPSVSVRLDVEMMDRLEREALADRRPVSQYVRNLILDAVDGDRERQVERVNR